MHSLMPLYIKALRKLLFQVGGGGGEGWQPRTQGLTYGKDPGWGWSRDFTKIDWIRGEGRVSNCMLPQKMLHFNYKE